MNESGHEDKGFWKEGIGWAAALSGISAVVLLPFYLM